MRGHRCRAKRHIHDYYFQFSLNLFNQLGGGLPSLLEDKKLGWAPLTLDLVDMLEWETCWAIVGSLR